MNLGGIYQLDKDTDASFQDGSDKEDDDASVESDSSSVDDTDLSLLLVLFSFLITRTILTKMIFLPHHGGRNTTLSIFHAKPDH